MKPNECKNCGTRIPRLIFDKDTGYAFECMNCGSRTRHSRNFEEAIAAWNAGDFAWIEANPAVKELVSENKGYCPCAIWQNEDTLCPCKEFREQKSGLCTCGRFKKMEDDLR